MAGGARVVIVAFAVVIVGGAEVQAETRRGS